MKFHKETKLLIAVGEESKLNLIDSVLMELLPPAEKQSVPPKQPLPANHSQPAPKAIGTKPAESAGKPNQN